jgi:hypothetical protein
MIFIKFKLKMQLKEYSLTLNCISVSWKFDYIWMRSLSLIS